MALTKKTAAEAQATAAGAGKFETEDNTVVADKAAAIPTQGAGQVADKAASPAAEAKAAEVATTAIAIAAKTSLTAGGGKVQAALQEFKDALPALDFGVIPRLIGSNGQVMDPDKHQLGSWVKMQLVSYNDEFVLSPGDDSAEAKELVKYSRDGKTVNETGQACAEYIAYLIAEGYQKASIKQYTQLVGILGETEKTTELAGGMVVISLSPQSRKSFEGFQIQQGVKLAMGKITQEGIDLLKITTKVQTNSNNQTYTTLNVAAA